MAALGRPGSHSSWTEVIDTWDEAGERAVFEVVTEIQSCLVAFLGRADISFENKSNQVEYGWSAQARKAREAPGHVVLPSPVPSQRAAVSS